MIRISIVGATGKTITRKLLINRLGYRSEAVYIPGDGYVEIEREPITFEIKCARLNIANRSAGQTAERLRQVSSVGAVGGWR